MPEGAAQLGDAALRHVMLHELMHLKRGDLLVIRLMNMLGAVYWFNPLVWLCFRLIREDIETACDHSVIRAIGTDQRLLYIGTVLQFAGRAANGDRTAAAMGMADGCPAMEKRIRGMYRAVKTGMKGRAIAALIAVMMLATGVLTACQPTPDEAVVVNRSELEEKIAATATPGTTYEPYEAAEHWTDTIERGALTVSVDTDVTLPGVDQYPVTILAPVTLSQERIDEMVHYFAGDSKLFCYPSVFTKADYQEMLIEARRGQLTDGEYVVTEGTERYAKSLEEKVANAPEDSPRVYTDTTLTYYTDLDGDVDYDAGPNYVSVGVECEDGNEATISAQNFTAGYGNSTRFGFWRVSGPVTESWYQECLAWGDDMGDCGEILDSISFDIDDARAQAYKVIGDLGIKDMALVSEEKAVLRSMGNQYGVKNDLPDRGGYVFEYVRASGGIPGYQLTSFGSDGYDQEPDYSPPFFQEMLTICVSEDGIEGFSWTGMAQVVETVSENVTLLPFADIQQALLDQIYYENAPKLEEFNTSESADVLGEMAVKVDVLSAELRVGYISVKDNTQQAMLVPMWVFETAETHSYGDEKGEPFPSKTYQFNAIDGGVIMPSVGAVAAEEDAIIAAEQEQE